MVGADSSRRAATSPAADQGEGAPRGASLALRLGCRRSWGVAAMSLPHALLLVGGSTCGRFDDEYGGTEDEREEGETVGLMTRVNGRGRLIPTPAPDLDSKLWWRGA